VITWFGDSAAKLTRLAACAGRAGGAATGRLSAEATWNVVGAEATWNVGRVGGSGTGFASATAAVGSGAGAGAAAGRRAGVAARWRAEAVSSTSSVS
jgi:hypothetical protein